MVTCDCQHRMPQSGHFKGEGVPSRLPFATKGKQKLQFKLMNLYKYVCTVVDGKTPEQFAANSGSFNSMAIICITMAGANNKKAKKNKAQSDCDKATCCMLCASLPFNMNSTLLGPAPHVHPDNLKQAAMKHPFSQQLPLPSASGSGSYARFSWPVCWIVLDFHLRQSERFTNDCEKLSRSSLEKKARQSGWLHCIQLHSDEWMIWGMKPSLKSPILICLTSHLHP